MAKVTLEIEVPEDIVEIVQAIFNIPSAVKDARNTIISGAYAALADAAKLGLSKQEFIGMLQEKLDTMNKNSGN